MQNSKVLQNFQKLIHDNARLAERATVLESVLDAYRGADSPAAAGQKLLSRLPESLFSIISYASEAKKRWGRGVPNSRLGGEKFAELPAIYKRVGASGIEKLLIEEAASPILRANAWTALAKSLRDSDKQSATAAARKAWENDPRPWRLKWLAFMEYQAGNIDRAAALFDYLPSDLALSDDDKLKIKRIKKLAENLRLEESAKKAASLIPPPSPAPAKPEELPSEFLAWAKQNKFNIANITDLKKELEELKAARQKIKTLEARPELPAEFLAWAKGNKININNAGDLKKELEELKAARLKIEELEGKSELPAQFLEWAKLNKMDIGGEEDLKRELKSLGAMRLRLKDMETAIGDGLVSARLLQKSCAELEASRDSLINEMEELKARYETLRYDYSLATGENESLKRELLKRRSFRSNQEVLDLLRDALAARDEKLLDAKRDLEAMQDKNESLEKAAKTSFMEAEIIKRNASYFENELARFQEFAGSVIMTQKEILARLDAALIDAPVSDPAPAERGAGEDPATEDEDIEQGDSAAKESVESEIEESSGAEQSVKETVDA